MQTQTRSNKIVPAVYRSYSLNRKAIVSKKTIAEFDFFMSCEFTSHETSQATYEFQ